MKTSTDLAQQIILCLRYFDRTNEAITDHINYLFNQFEEMVKREKEMTRN